MPGRVEGGTQRVAWGCWPEAAKRSGLIGGGVCRCGELTTQEEESSPWGRSMVLLAAMLLAQVGGEQLLGGLVNMAHHQRHGGSTLGLNQSRDHG